VEHNTELTQVSSRRVTPNLASILTPGPLSTHTLPPLPPQTQQGAQPAERFIRDLVECEQGYINTDNPAFIGGTRAVKEVMEDREARRQAAAAAGAGAGGEGGRGGKGSGESRQVRPPCFEEYAVECLCTRP
jgi:hypothetical protein